MSIFLNGEPLNVTLFPDNTSQVWQIPGLRRDKAEVHWEYEYEHEFMHIAQLKDLLDYYYIPVDLYLPYLPYARQDKYVSNVTTFALSTFAKLLNSLNFKNVYVTDVHSNIAYLIKNLNNIIPRVDGYCKQLNIDCICFPDFGAYEKYRSYIPHNLPTILGVKKRDPNTGEITEHKITGNVLKVVLVRDDICDGGKTFISVAKLLQENGAKEINLFVTHGIFSKGLKVLHEAGINRIFTYKGEAFENRETKQIYYKDIQTNV